MNPVNNKRKAYITVIAYGVERDTESLKDLLRRNGVILPASISKSDLQRKVTAALKESPTFRNEFYNWVVVRTNNQPLYKNCSGNYAGADGPSIFDPFDTTPVTFGNTPNFQPTTDLSQSPSQLAGLGLNGTPTSSNTSSTASTGFWSGISANSLLSFLGDQMNNYTTIVQSKTDKAIVDAAIEKERLEQNTTPTAKPGTKPVTVFLYALGAIAVVIGVVYAYKKYKK